MKPGQNPNKQRSRGRSNNNNNNNNNNGGGNGGGKRHIPSRNQTYDSNGPDIRIRGNAHQVLEKYLTLARDANSQGDRIAAENYYQHAEHYFRVINSQNGGRPQPRPMSTPADDHIMLAGDLEEAEQAAEQAEAAESTEAEANEADANDRDANEADGQSDIESVEAEAEVVVISTKPVSVQAEVTSDTEVQNAVDRNAPMAGAPEQEAEPAPAPKIRRPRRAPVARAAAVANS